MRRTTSRSASTSRRRSAPAVLAPALAAALAIAGPGLMDSAAAQVGPPVGPPAGPPPSPPAEPAPDDADPSDPDPEPTPALRPPAQPPTAEPASDPLAPLRDDRRSDDPAPDELHRRGLHAEPIVIESIGLRFFPPRGGMIEVRKPSPNTTLVLLTDRQTPPRWRLRLQRLTGGGIDPAEQIDRQLDQLRSSGVGIKVLHNQPRTVDGQPGRLCLVRQSLQAGDVITGTLLVPTADGMLLTATILALPEHIDLLQRTLDAMLTHTELRGAAEVVEAVDSRLQASRQFMASITPANLRNVCGRSQWARVFRPGDDGSADTEVGYLHVATRAGTRSEADHSTADRSDHGSGGEEGLLVEVKARIVDDADRNRIVDVTRTYWLAWDRSEEWWTMIATLRQGEATRSEVESGMYLPPSTSSPRPRLFVSRTRENDPVADSLEWPVPEAYLPQTLTWVLGPLLIEKGVPSRTFEHYCYHAETSPSLTRRTDRWEPARDVPGGWRLTTRPMPDGPATVNTYDARGRLVRQTRPNGIVVEPTTLEALRQIWDQ